MTKKKATAGKSTAKAAKKAKAVQKVEKKEKKKTGKSKDVEDENEDLEGILEQVRVVAYSPIAVLGAYLVS